MKTIQVRIDSLIRPRTSLVVQWLRLCASTAGGVVPGHGTKIPHVSWQGQKGKKGKIYPSEWDKALSHSTPILTPMATHSNTGSSMETGKFHGWRSLVGYSSWGCKESDTTERLHFLSFYSSFWRRRWQPTPVFLPGESHGRRGPGGLQSMGLQRVGHD